MSCLNEVFLDRLPDASLPSYISLKPSSLKYVNECLSTCYVSGTWLRIVETGGKKITLYLLLNSSIYTGEVDNKQPSFGEINNKRCGQMLWK